MANVIPLTKDDFHPESIDCETCGCNCWAMWGYVENGLVRLSSMVCCECEAEMRAEQIGE